MNEKVLILNLCVLFIAVLRVHSYHDYEYQYNPRQYRRLRRPAYPPIRRSNNPYNPNGHRMRRSRSQPEYYGWLAKIMGGIKTNANLGVKYEDPDNHFNYDGQSKYEGEKEVGVQWD